VVSASQTVARTFDVDDALRAQRLLRFGRHWRRVLRADPRARLSTIPTIQNLTAEPYVQLCVRIEGLPLASFLPLPLAMPKPDPMLSYTFTDGRVIHLHETCDALWQQELATG
jgi:hypothetical protein